MTSKLQQARRSRLLQQQQEMTADMTTTIRQQLKDHKDHRCTPECGDTYNFTGFFDDSPDGNHHVDFSNFSINQWRK